MGQRNDSCSVVSSSLRQKGQAEANVKPILCNHLEVGVLLGQNRKRKKAVDGGRIPFQTTIDQWQWSPLERSMIGRQGDIIIII